MKTIIICDAYTIAILSNKFKTRYYDNDIWKLICISQQQYNNNITFDGDETTPYTLYTIHNIETEHEQTFRSDVVENIIFRWLFYNFEIIPRFHIWLCPNSETSFRFIAVPAANRCHHSARDSECKMCSEISVRLTIFSS